MYPDMSSLISSSSEQTTVNITCSIVDSTAKTNMLVKNIEFEGPDFYGQFRIGEMYEKPVLNSDWSIKNKI